jgi:PEP-CTERM/exosortase A-associated glycosyltransferase
VTPTSRLKILHVLDHSLPLHSGYAFRTRNIFRAQVNMGWDPVAITSPEHDRILNAHGKQDEKIAGFRCYRSGALYPGRPGLFRAWRLVAILVRRISEVIQAEKPDLLHVHSPVLNALAALWVGHETSIPVVYEIRSSWEDSAVDRGMYAQNSWRYKFMHLLEMWACRKADHVAVLCNGLRDKLIKEGIPSAKLTVVSNGVNLDEFQPREPDTEYLRNWRLEGKQVIGFIGSFSRYEGLDLLLEAAASPCLARRDIALVLVGGGRMEAALKEQTKRLRLEEQVIIPGRISHDRIPGVYALMDILAYPRHSIRLTESVTPLKPLEGMAMRKPIVASATGGHREIIEHGKTGWLFSPGNLSDLTAALALLLDDRNLRNRLASQALEWVRTRSWNNTTAAYADIYGRALGN